MQPNTGASRLPPPPYDVGVLPAFAMPDGHSHVQRSSGGDWGHLVSVRHSDYPNQLQPHVCQLFRGLDRSIPAGEEAGVRRPPSMRQTLASVED